MLTRLLLLTWFLVIVLVAHAQPPQAPDLLPHAKVAKDFTPPRDKLGETIERLMVTKDPDAAIAKAEADSVLWVRWTYWPDLYDGSTELFNALPNARHVLKPDPDGGEFVQFRGADGEKRWMKANRIDLVGGKAVAAGIRAGGTKKAVSTHSEDVAKITIDGNIYDDHPDGRLTWCPHCNGGPDPDPAKTTRMSRERVASRGATPVKTTKAAPHLTYAEAYHKAKGDGRKTKPLVIWVGGNFCERCVRESENDFVHYFTDSWPGMKAPSIVVSVWDEHAFYVTGRIDWWIEGDREFGHLASIRNSIRKWRDDRNEGKVGANSTSGRRGPSPATGVSPLDSDPFVQGWDAAKQEAISSGREVQRMLPGQTQPHTFRPDGSVSGFGQFVLEPFGGGPSPAAQAYRGGGFAPQQARPVMMQQAQPQMRMAPQSFGGVSAGVPRRGG